MGATSCPQTGVAETILALFDCSGACGASAALCRIALAEVSRVIDRRLADFSFTQDPSRATMLGDGTKKHRRIDEDLRRLATLEAPKTGRAPHAAGFLRATGMCSAKNAPGWCEQDMLRYMSVGWVLGSNAQTVCLTFDAGRVGNPAENVEVMACQVYSSDGGGAFMWLPPQAICWAWPVGQISGLLRAVVPSCRYPPGVGPSGFGVGWCNWERVANTGRDRRIVGPIPKLNCLA